MVTTTIGPASYLKDIWSKSMKTSWFTIITMNVYPINIDFPSFFNGCLILRLEKSLFRPKYSAYICLFFLTRRYGPLPRPTSCSCGGHRAKKEICMLFWLIFGNFWCPVVALLPFSSNLSNFKKNPKKKIQHNSKNFKKNH